MSRAKNCPLANHRRRTVAASGKASGAIDLNEHGAKVAGVTRPLFSDTVVAMLHSQSRGISRVLGNLARTALLDASLRKQDVVEESNVRRALTELQKG